MVTVPFPVQYQPRKRPDSVDKIQVKQVFLRGEHYKTTDSETRKDPTDHFHFLILSRGFK